MKCSICSNIISHYDRHYYLVYDYWREDKRACEECTMKALTGEMEDEETRNKIRRAFYEGLMDIMKHLKGV